MSAPQNHILKDILAKGYPVEPSEVQKKSGVVYRGYTLEQLGLIGLDKAIMKKAVKLGVVGETHVRQSDGQVRLFFYTTVPA